MLPANFPLHIVIADTQAELAILYPSAGATWFTNDTVPLNWTSTQPDIDPKQFRVLLSGAGLAAPQELANEGESNPPSFP